MSGYFRHIGVANLQLANFCNTEKQKKKHNQALGNSYVTQLSLIIGQNIMVLSPNPTITTTAAAAVPCSVSHLTEAIKSQKPYLDSLLLKTGAVIIRGFDVKTAEDFNAVVEAFGYEELSYVGGTAPRTNVVGHVFTANSSPPDQHIGFHHEMAQELKPPSKLFFFCEVAPTLGGGGGVWSHIVYERIRQRYPEFVEILEEHGLIYSVLLGEDDDRSYIGGRSWKSVFSTGDKSVAEERFVI
ncbi:hypothetical protein QYF36_013536 [Acer negundo]|nr:hypothetical protein QYF36_013536 [Acer negundo]